jgi:WD40 repeat protein
MQDGTLNFINPAHSTGGPSLQVRGHQAPANYLDYDLATGRIYTSDQAGRACMWIPVDDAKTKYSTQVVTGEVATKKSAGISAAGGELAVIAWDDKLRLGDATTGELKATVALPGQPKGVVIVAGNPKIKLVVTGNAILLIDGAAVAATIDAPWNPTCVDSSADGSVVAVGGKDKKVHIYKLAGTSLTADGETKEFGGEISVVRVSPDGTTVAAGDSVRDVRLYSTNATKDPLRTRWTYHTTRVTGLRWSPSGKYIASVSTDRRLCVWDPSTDAPKISIDLAHPQPFADVVWADDGTLWTLGTDGTVVRKVLSL